MITFQKNSAAVIAFLKENHYSERTIRNYEKIYANAEAYLHNREVVYSPEVGEEMLRTQEDLFFGVKGAFIRISSIRKINAIYLHGDLAGVQVSPQREYKKNQLEPEFVKAIDDFIESRKGIFSFEQLKNASRRVNLFFCYLQYNGILRIDQISYEVIISYHEHLLHLNLKRVSRMLEESTVHQMLHFLSENGQVPVGIYLCMLLISKDELFIVENLLPEERHKLDEYLLCGSDLSPAALLKIGTDLLRKHLDNGYVPGSCKTAERALMHFYLFLDMNGFGYTPEIAVAWLNYDAVKRAFRGSSWKSARRFLNVLGDTFENGSPDLNKVYRKGISGLKELPEWCRDPLMEFAALRTREKLETATVNNDIYSILRFVRFLLREGIQSYAELTGEILTKFNLYDKHGTPEGKNACNARIRRFLKYLGREGCLQSKHLYMSLATTSAEVETIVTVFNDEEVRTIRDYVASATTPLEIRDSAIILIGCDMGIRGCDIVNLQLGDIDWKNHCMHFGQDKTDADVIVFMPTAVGNAIFRYLKEVRARNTGNDTVFLSIHAPFKPLSRSVCYGTLHRILPDRNVRGSGFHVARKSFSTNRLRSGVEPSMIADAIGHAGTGSITPYLSLDDSRMSLCALSLSELSIPMEGGF